MKKRNNKQRKHRKLKEYIRDMRKRYKGFTLIELLVVVSLIGIISSFTTMNFLEVRKKSRDDLRKSDIVRIQSNLEQYRSDNGSYPISVANGTQLNNTPCGGTFQAGNIMYMKQIPCDPLGAGSNYNNGDYYYYSADGKSYSLGACLERKTDPLGQATMP